VKRTSYEAPRCEMFSVVCYYSDLNIFKTAQSLLASLLHLSMRFISLNCKLTAGKEPV